MYTEWDIEDTVIESDTEKDNYIFDLEQGSKEWLDVRSGKITGSKFSDILAKGANITREKYKVHLAIERITGVPIAMDYKSAAMIKGNTDEPEARQHYAFTCDDDVISIAFVYHPEIKNAGCSPDSLVGNDGLLEIKCPNLVTHVGYLLDKKIPGTYLKQMHWQLACTGRKWVDWVSYCKEMPIHLRCLCIRVHRDESIISSYEVEANKFNKEVDDLVIKLNQIGA